MAFSFSAFAPGWLPLFLVLPLTLCRADYSVWDFAPNFANDPIQPYPSLKNPDGTNISIENLKGTRLYGWKGCSPNEVEDIKDAWDDFYKLAQQKDLYKKIDWASQAATDFWGPASGDRVIPKDTRKEIQQVFKAAQQMYSSLWHSYPPWMWYMYLWIEVRCSDSKTGKDSSDPDNKCGDAKPNEGKCPGGSMPNPGGEENLMQAFADPHPDDNGGYSRITFCNGFFKLNSLTEIVNLNKKQPKAVKNRLDKWDNRARAFFHEVTHLDYFMSAGDDKKAKTPYISDLEIRYKTASTQPAWYVCYGPYNAKVLRNWLDPDPKYSAYFTQRNADNYAWFAMANYVTSLIGFYPTSPSPGNKRPMQEPRDADSHEAPLSVNSTASSNSTISSNGDLIPGDEQDPPPDFTYPGCGDKVEADDINADIINASVMKPSAATEYIYHLPSGQSSHMGHGPVVPYRPGDTIVTLTALPTLSGVPTVPTMPALPATTAIGDTCDVSYRWLYDLVEVRGKAWTTAELGTNGENLKTQIAGCGDITDWNFQLTPNDCCMDWYVSCHLPIGVKDCVGRAVVTAAGPGATIGDCHGAG
ncbi:hypothetical protein OIDMADRAFT_23751 [Oidiodendron maius Zn]|uniref:Lysine-specific metallo-endopeptidase domain-containing protein n=1 Tax=Oidiodendron maius (strain Zn) TaxID=913774 RepID=A0A0C3DCE2_OIDMZ|nr:hypothetical protein OIDMADRAFT_23751 [Oidiodendron maius Zn]